MSWNMRPKKDLEPWKEVKYVALCCGDLIWSMYSGEYDECKCGEAFVDQTREYTRTGGKVKLYIEDSEAGLE